MTYSISCTGTGGTATGSVTVGVGSAPIQPSWTYKYRNQSPYLFQTVSTGTYLSPLPAYPGYYYYADLWWPTYLSVDPQAGWQWRNPGWDWIDKNLLSQGTGAWASFGANAVAGSTAIYTYTGTDVTALVQYVQSNSKWLALMVTNTGWARAAGGIVTPGQTPPSINVTYTDGSTGVLRARIVANDSRGGSYPVTITRSLWLPVFMEFDRPIKPVSSAKINITITEHWSGNATVQIFLLDPPVNSEPITDTTGLASLAWPLDTGLSSVPGILWAQKIVDGSVLSDFVVWNDSNKWSEFNYDPAIWGGTPNRTLWPHKDAGKWIQRNALMSNVSIVGSSFTGEGFTPLAPGIWAMRLSMPYFNVVDGQEVTNGWRVASDMIMFMDEPNFGRLDHIFVRYYVRMGTPYSPQVSDRKLILSNGVPRWTDMGGKMGIGPSHATSYGGVSGSSGWGYGWQMRQSWKDNEAGQWGPDEQGVTQGFHLYDYQSNNPTGYRYGTEQDGTFERWGQKWGLGSMMYAGQWYEIETELKLNTVFTGSNTYLPDGELRAWVDGKLVWEGTGMVFRTLPIYDPGYNPSRIRPARELGVKELWLNWFHGGQSENTYPRTMFYSNIAWGKSRIGKMQTQ